MYIQQCSNAVEGGVRLQIRKGHMDDRGELFVIVCMQSLSLFLSLLCLTCSSSAACRSALLCFPPLLLCCCCCCCCRCRGRFLSVDSTSRGSTAASSTGSTPLELRVFALLRILVAPLCSCRHLRHPLLGQQACPVPAASISEVLPVSLPSSLLPSLSCNTK